MDLIKILCDAAAATEFKKTSNFYFEDHICAADGNNKRIRMDLVLTDETTDELIRFGKCSGCGICFYHTDHRSGAL